MSADGGLVGLDVSKVYLDVAVRSAGMEWRSPNTADGVKRTAARLKGLPELVVLEATGGFELPVASALADLGLPVVLINLRQVRDFARSVGRVAKTDVLDARVLDHFAEAVRPEPRRPIRASSRSTPVMIRQSAGSCGDKASPVD